MANRICEWCRETIYPVENYQEHRFWYHGELMTFTLHFVENGINPPRYDAEWWDAYWNELDYDYDVYEHGSCAYYWAHHHGGSDPELQ